MFSSFELVSERQPFGKIPLISNFGSDFLEISFGAMYSLVGFS